MAEHGDTRVTRDRFQTLAGDRDADRRGMRTVVTTDPEAIRQWASRHGAEPATGEATQSGGAGRHVVDGGAGIRFNFPGSSAFRPISWDEWFEHFDAHDLAFVYDVEDQTEVRALAHRLWLSRGGPANSAQDDWFAAERELQADSAGRPGFRYRLIKRPR
jgi:hypothetical protein